MIDRMMMFVILQKYDFSSKSQHGRYIWWVETRMFVILQKYDFSSKSQQSIRRLMLKHDVCDTAKVRFFKQITTNTIVMRNLSRMFVILQKYDFSSKSQQLLRSLEGRARCLWYCKSTIFQANHNPRLSKMLLSFDVCDTAKVRFFKQITTVSIRLHLTLMMFVILQKYDFSSKSQPVGDVNAKFFDVCDTAKVRFFKQITTECITYPRLYQMFVILQKYDFSSKSQHYSYSYL